MTISAARGLAPVREVFPTGLAVLVKETRTTPAVAVNASLQAGGICDPADRLGLAYFLSRIIDRGTATRSKDRIAEELDLRGVSLSTAVTRHALTLSCTCLAEDFEIVLGILADIIRQPLCADDEVLTRRLEILTTLRQDDDNPAVKAIERVMELLYGAEHPYGRRAKGTPDGVEGTTRDDLLRFHRTHVAPNRLSLVIVGDVDAASVVETARRLFGEWTQAVAPAPVVPPPPTRHERARVIVPMMNKAQTDIAYGFVTIPRSDPAYHAYSIMNNVLGQHGLGGRLGHSIREVQGMAYYAFSFFEANVVAGPLVVRAGVNAANVERTIASIDEEISRFVADGATAAELDDAKRYLIGSLPRMLETNAGIASFLQSVQQFDLGLDYDLRLPGLLQTVTRDDVHAAARRSLSPEWASIVVAGPYEPDTGPT